MRVLIAPDGFTGTLSAAGAAAAMAAGWARARPRDEIERLPMSDGGPGFLDVLAAAVGGRARAVAATGPLGDPREAPLLIADDGTAYVESALACGSALVPPGRSDPVAATTFGVGQLLAAAREAGCRRVVVGLGGSATTDAGAGMLAALGAGPARVLGRGGAGLVAVTPDQLVGLVDVRRAWAGVDLVAASDVDVPLLGEHGAARGFGPQKGADAAAVAVLEQALAAFARAAAEVLGLDPSGEPGAGAAGGLGYGLALLGGRRSGGAAAVAAAVDLAAAVARAGARGGLVLTGEGRLDWQSLRGKVVAAVAGAGRSAGVPVHAVAGQVRLSAQQLADSGLAGAHAVAATPEQVQQAMADPAGTLAARVQALAATWTT